MFTRILLTALAALGSAVATLILWIVLAVEGIYDAAVVTALITSAVAGWYAGRATWSRLPV